MIIKHFLQLRKSWLYLTVGSLLFFTTCVEPFQPSIDKFDNVLVVDGTITDLPGPYTVTLSISSNIYNREDIFIEDAIVQIIEEGGEQEYLSDRQNGVYKTASDGIQGVPGKRYKISIELPDGRQYESPFQELKQSTPIESIEATVEYHYFNEQESEVPGYQFYVNTALSENSQDNFLWLMEGTYKYVSDYTMDYIWAGSLQEVMSPSAFMTCYRTYTIDQLFTYNTAGLSQPKIEHLPLNFVRADDVLINIRYSLLAKQYTLDDNAFTFWKNIQGQIESLESLYSSQPFQIRGNVKNINDDDEPVLGYFLVAGLSEKRIFVDPPPGLNIELSKCFLDYMAYGRINFIPPRLYPVYVHEDANGGRALSDLGCIDCTELGGVTQRPSFWEE